MALNSRAAAHAVLHTECSPPKTNEHIPCTKHIATAEVQLKDGDILGPLLPWHPSVVMLRSGLSRRALQQTCLLAGWQEARVLEPGLHAQLQQVRPFADKSSDGNGNSSVKYARERAAFESSLSELRKQWAQQRLARLERRAAKEEEKRLEREAAKAQRAQQDAAAKQAKLQQLLERQAAEREIHARAKVERLKRHFLRQEVLEVALEERRLRLLEESKNWITADTLDMRIKEALDNPVPLFPSAEQQQQPQAAAAASAAV